MSQENVEIIRGLAEALAKGDDWEFVFEHYHPEVEFQDLHPAPDAAEAVHGLDRLREVVAHWVEVYDEFRPEIYELIDADPWVICDTRWYGTGRGSDLLIDFRAVDAYELEGGKIRRAILGYADVAAARRALGLPE